MAPDVEELIKKVNNLTLDKNRLRQKLAQLSMSSSLSKDQESFNCPISANNNQSPLHDYFNNTSNYNNNNNNSKSNLASSGAADKPTASAADESLHNFSTKDQHSAYGGQNDNLIQLNHSAPSTPSKLGPKASSELASLLDLTAPSASPSTATTATATTSCGPAGDTVSHSSSSSSSHNNNTTNNPDASISSKVILEVEISTSCEEDLVYMNMLYRQRLLEYKHSWDYVQTNLATNEAELVAVQHQYTSLKDERNELEANLQKKCDELDKVKSELQTVVLNYETQLSAMSEHLSTIANQQVHLARSSSGSDFARANSSDS